MSSFPLFWFGSFQWISWTSSQIQSEGFAQLSSHRDSQVKNSLAGKDYKSRIIKRIIFPRRNEIHMGLDRTTFKTYNKIPPYRSSPIRGWLLDLDYCHKAEVYHNQSILKYMKALWMYFELHFVACTVC